MLSILVIAESGRAASLAGIRAIEQQIQVQATTAGQDVEILIMDLAGEIADRDLQGSSSVRLLPCAGMRPAEARNIALKEAQGGLLCFTDVDCRPLGDWLIALTKPFNDELVIGVKGAYACESKNAVSRFVQMEHEARYNRLRYLRSIDFVDMYSAAYRRSVLLANGGFDERFGRLEEQELAYRLAGRGYKMVFSGEARVSHQHPSRIVDYVKYKAMIGYWKAQVIRLYPDRGLSDSYTPKMLKLQIAVLYVAGLLMLLSWLQPWLIIAAFAALLLFAASTLPFLVQVWALDRPIIWISLPMLVARAIALGAGYGWGILHPAPSLIIRPGPIAGSAYLAKRFVDVIGSLVGLAITILCAPLLSLLIKLDSPGPVLFRQVRIGRGGQSFVLYKFRTMATDAEERLDELIDIGRLDQPSFKLIEDPRVTRVGRFLRRWSLDELPQFWNVLRSDMSLVGPRPEEARIVAMYSDWHRRRLAVKPGMTGPMQIRGRGDLALDERVKLEIEYIEEYTLWQDMKILLGTLPSVLRGEGAR